MGTTTLKMKDGVITLPPRIQKLLGDSEELFAVPGEKTLILKPVQKSLGKVSDFASRISTPPMSRRQIEKEIRAYRAH